MRDRDGVADQSSLWLCHLKEGEVLQVSVLHALALHKELLAYGRQLLASIELLDGTLQALQTKNERCNVIERSARGGTPDDNLDTIGCSLMLVVLAGTGHCASLELLAVR